MESRRIRIGPLWDLSASWSRKRCHETRRNNAVGMGCRSVGRWLACVASTGFCHLNLAWCIRNLSTWRAKAIRPEGQCLAGYIASSSQGCRRPCLLHTINGKIPTVYSKWSNPCNWPGKSCTWLQRTFAIPRRLDSSHQLVVNSGNSRWQVIDPGKNVHAFVCFYILWKGVSW